MATLAKYPVKLGIDTNKLDRAKGEYREFTLIELLNNSGIDIRTWNTLDLIGVEGLARRLNCCQQTIRRLEARGGLPKCRRLVDQVLGVRVWQLSDIYQFVHDLNGDWED